MQVGSLAVFSFEKICYVKSHSKLFERVDFKIEYNIGFLQALFSLGGTLSKSVGFDCEDVQVFI